MPSSCSLANESETSIAFDVTDDKINKTPWSLILFWMVENEQYEMFWYLWEEIGFLDWGMQNLEWIMTVLTYNKNLLFLEEIFKSSTFKKIIRNQHF